MKSSIDPYSPADSALHRWDPRWKIIAFALLVFSLAIEHPEMREHPVVGRDLTAEGLGLVLAVGLLLIGRVPIVDALRRMRPALFLLSLLFVVFALSYPGETIDLGSISISKTGTLVAAAIVLKAFALLITGFALVATTRFDRLMKALRCLHMPTPVVLTALFAYRYTFVYLDQQQKMKLAMRTRGFAPRTDRRTLRVLGHSIGMLLVRSIDRVQTVSRAMKARGFTGDFHTIASFRTRTSDVVALCVTAACGALIVAWRFR